MPLKHSTETRLIFLLGLMIALAGAAIAFLPPISVAVVPWLCAFALAIAYPLFLYPLLKEKRADYEFRALHFLPALMLLIWLVLDMLAAFRPSWSFLQTLFSWSWALPAVVFGIGLLAIFCLQVIRQRWKRLGLLAGVLAAFVLFSQWSEFGKWDQYVAHVLWEPAISGEGSIASNGTSSNLDPSHDPAEEKWREQLREMERRSRMLVSSNSSATVIAQASSSIGSAGNTSSYAAGSSSSVPPRLPSAGFGIEFLFPLMGAGFMGSLHRKTVRRKELA